ncbi:hypothetical protein [Pseudomonas sp. 22 E 5]|nr:hypothetical protein [Pseudomonas sp. 22 E 5]
MRGHRFCRHPAGACVSEGFGAGPAGDGGDATPTVEAAFTQGVGFIVELDVHLLRFGLQPVFGAGIAVGVDRGHIRCPFALFTVGFAEQAAECIVAVLHGSDPAFALGVECFDLPDTVVRGGLGLVNMALLVFPFDLTDGLIRVVVSDDGVFVSVFSGPMRARQRYGIVNIEDFSAIAVRTAAHLAPLVVFQLLPFAELIIGVLMVGGTQFPPESVIAYGLDEYLVSLFNPVFTDQAALAIVLAQMGEPLRAGDLHLPWRRVGISRRLPIGRTLCAGG